ncbi:DNA-formamidopyrimidine glycosylase [Dehalococcoides mccartyi]|uniref:DNA-formamidopyrimidine glycosylase n=1 Tax=Dehalococcoides mccartyi TaxID=61435 RepID=UPI00098F207F|nr:DNA-formamidopyrimidine glycosylase [Dehalococcoides mccartyi]AQU06372.1 DNA-formamidopyrimidine glycosylase [Dehalococcoides mccartyi]AQU07814.1 DNA-formamidopyrimidine glycosylase [Dehalococcoides mccartyi]BEL01315.1 bifunctional DNA-formamidopyrimidine glycosylase/DNA-(apurinic or apyrimidinic site) lyase [Dehalococcoides mccartyi]
MPELPEVETVKNEIMPHLLGKKIIRMEALWAKTLCPPEADFDALASGTCVTGLSRRGKYIIISLSSGLFISVHLKMSGGLTAIRAENGQAPRFTRAIFHLENGEQVYFTDIRKFGRITLLAGLDSVLEKLGPEPLEEIFTAGVFWHRLSGRKGPIKAVLLDQKVLAGVGNMYADEALFKACLNPLRSAESLSMAEVERLHSAIQSVLHKAIQNKGASVSTYHRPDGSKGGAQLEFNVAHRRGESCPVCGAPITRQLIRQRACYFCPRCQS